MLAFEALICFSRSRRFSAFLRAPVFFLGIFHRLWDRKRYVVNTRNMYNIQYMLMHRYRWRIQHKTWILELPSVNYVSSPFASFSEFLFKCRIRVQSLGRIMCWTMKNLVIWKELLLSCPLCLTVFEVLCLWNNIMLCITVCNGPLL